MGPGKGETGIPRGAQIAGTGAWGSLSSSRARSVGVKLVHCCLVPPTCTPILSRGNSGRKRQISTLGACGPAGKSKPAVDLRASAEGPMNNPGQIRPRKGHCGCRPGEKWGGTEGRNSPEREERDTEKVSTESGTVKEGRKEKRKRQSQGKTVFTSEVVSAAPCC